jgi:transcriptional regulator with XRE-family HTH domain
MEGADINQRQLADRLGVRQSTVSQWVNGQRNPDAAMLVRVARELGAAPDWLIEGRGAQPASARKRGLERVREAVHWVPRAAPPDGGRDGGNANQFTIRPSIGSLVREAIQNSVDEALGRLHGPVRMRFRLLSLRDEAKRRFLAAMQWDELQRHITASIEQAQDQQVAGGLQEAIDMAESGELLVLQISDANTRGLIGPEDGEGNFAALTRDNLFSHKANEAAGGSYGLGKAMQYAASAFGTVLFVSNLAEPEPETGNSRGRFMARAELTYHEHDSSERCAGPLWLGREPVMHKPISYWAEGDNDALLRDLHMRREDHETGTTIAIVGLRDLDADRPRPPREIVEQIGSEAERNFWPAIEAGELEVRVEYVEIDDPDLEPQPEIDALVIPEQSREVGPLVGVFRAHQRGDVEEILIDEGDVVATTAELRVPARRMGEDKHARFSHEAIVLVRRATAEEALDITNSSTLRHAALFRGANMVVKMVDLNRAAIGAHPFQVVVLAGLAAGGGDEARRAEEFLRAAEPPSHDDWMYTPRLRRQYAQGSKKALHDFENSIRLAVRRVLDVEIDQAADGPRDLSRRFKFGDPPTPERAPRIVVSTSSVNDEGAWEIEAAVRLRGDLRRHVVGRPELRFLGESGGSSRVKWSALTAVGDGLRVSDDGTALVIAPQKRTVRFRGVTEPNSHPAPADESTATLVFLPVREED